MLAKDALDTTASGYYESSSYSKNSILSLKKAILESKIAIIAEIKSTSPTTKIIRKVEPIRLSKNMEKGGATGISILTEPKHFNGSLSYLKQARESVEIPLLMKDIIVAPIQLDAAANLGADAILLIQALFDRGYCKEELQNMISYAHMKGLEVLLEIHSIKEFLKAVESKADMIGINNRDLKTFKVDLDTTVRILSYNLSYNKVIVSESGIRNLEDIKYLQIFHRIL